MQYRIVRNVDGQWLLSETTDIFAWAEVRNIATKMPTVAQPHLRAELKDQPRLQGFAGPMWDGDAVRYEDTTACNILST